MSVFFFPPLNLSDNKVTSLLSGSIMVYIWKCTGVLGLHRCLLLLFCPPAPLAEALAWFTTVYWPVIVLFATNNQVQQQSMAKYGKVCPSRTKYSQDRLITTIPFSITLLSIPKHSILLKFSCADIGWDIRRHQAQKEEETSMAWNINYKCCGCWSIVLLLASQGEVLKVLWSLNSTFGDQQSKAKKKACVILYQFQKESLWKGNSLLW